MPVLSRGVQFIASWTNLYISFKIFEIVGLSFHYHQPVFL
jgi:hypothetical protein